MADTTNVPAPVVRQASLLDRLLALAAPHSFSEPLVQADYALELSRTPALQAASPVTQQEKLNGLRQLTIDRLLQLRRALLGSFASMASAVAVAYFFRAFDIAPMLPRPLLAIGSVLCFATATLGRLGWGGQSLKGDTSVERLDQRVFHVLYWIGMCWGALAIL